MRQALIVCILLWIVPAFSNAQSSHNDSLLITARQKVSEAGTPQEKAAAFQNLYAVFEQLQTSAPAFKDSSASYLDSAIVWFDSTLTTLKKAKPAVSLSNFRFRLYTDVVGFNDGQPNSPIQNEVYFNWDIAKNGYRWIRSKDGEKEKWKLKAVDKKKAPFLLFSNLVFPIIDLWQTKAEDSLKYRQVNYDPQLMVWHLSGDTADTVLGPVRHIHTLDLIRHSHFQISGKLNILTIKNRSNGVSIMGDIFGTVYRTGVQDSLLNEDDQRFKVTSVGLGYNIKFRVKPLNSHFQLDASYTGYGLRLLSNHIYQRFGKLYYPDGDRRNSKLGPAPGKGDYFNGIGIYSAEIRFSTKTNAKRKDNDDGWFLRMNFFTNPLLSKREEFDYNNNYFQLQLGVNKGIDDLIAFFKP
jgi:hypothetical protein